MRTLQVVLLLGLTLCVSTSTATADDKIDPAQRDFFEKKIRPVLVKHCYECHSTDSAELGGKLRLDTREGMRSGGEAGPAIVSGKPDQSVLIQALRYDGLEMPPEEPLPAAVVNDFVSWVKNGAVDPRVAKVPVEAKAAGVDENVPWSFRPRATPELPSVADMSWPRDPLDRFVLARLEAAELTPTGDADPATLARRLHYDLIGLPPSHETIEAFELDYQQHGQPAVARLVDQLLASPQFGVRWGRHWLDVARYAESNGDDGLSRNATFPHAWRYRDYVIDAFNNDVPYNRFLTEQIAGDLLPADSADQRNRNLVATGFLALGSKPAKAMNNNFTMDIVDDQINVVSTAVTGMSVACARCHDHKHDPIPTRDYYALAGIFSSSETLYGKAADEKLTAPPTELHKLTSQYNEQKKVDRRQTPQFPESYAEEIESLEPISRSSLNSAETTLEVAGVKFDSQNYAAVKESSLRGKLPADNTSYSVAFWFKNDTKNNARPITAYLFSRAPWADQELPGDHLGIGGTFDKQLTGKLFVFNGKANKVIRGGTTVIEPGTWNHVVLVRHGKRVKLFLNGADRAEIDAELPPTFGESIDFSLATRSDSFAPLVGSLAQFAVFDRNLSDDQIHKLHAASGQPQGAPPAPATGLAMGVRERAKPADCKVHIKGESNKLGESVPRGKLTAWESTSAGTIKIEKGSSGRLQLAQWLTQEEHPHTARVAVNRIWLHLFGQAIVTTPDDFGVYGAKPTHPQLLDHLANRFVNEGWSVKQLIRQIVLSRTYQLDSRAAEELIVADPDNRLLARHQRRRLDAEALRDSLLAASGQLDLQPEAGSAIEKIDMLINWPPGEATNLHRASNHRSIYLCMLRHAPPPDLAAFDLPTAVGVTGQREVTTLPAHGLFLLNSSLVVEQAEALAREVLAEEKLSADQRVKTIYHRTLRRSPTDTELNRALHHIETISETLNADDQLPAWSSLTQALLAANEFRYVD